MISTLLAISSFSSFCFSLYMSGSVLTSPPILLTDKLYNRQSLYMFRWVKVIIYLILALVSLIVFIGALDFVLSNDVASTRWFLN